GDRLKQPVTTPACSCRVALAGTSVSDGAMCNLPEYSPAIFPLAKGAGAVLREAVSFAGAAEESRGISAGFSIAVFGCSATGFLPARGLDGSTGEGAERVGAAATCG